MAGKEKSVMSIAALATIAVVSLVGCETTTKPTSGGGDQSSEMSQQWRVADQATMASMLKGNTTEEVTGRWAVHYANDGRKMVAVRGKDVVERKWWINEKGEWCSTLYRDSEESCELEIYVNGSNKARIMESSGATKWEFNVLPGNPRNL